MSSIWFVDADGSLFESPFGSMTFELPFVPTLGSFWDAAVASLCWLLRARCRARLAAASVAGSPLASPDWAPSVAFCWPGPFAEPGSFGPGGGACEGVVVAAPADLGPGLVLPARASAAALPLVAAWGLAAFPRSAPVASPKAAIGAAS